LFYGIFGLEYSFRFGTRPEEYLGDLATWEKAEKSLREILNEKVGEGNYKVLEGDGAFYGPKVDILMKDALGREWQMGTIQLDFQQPRRFHLKYSDNEGTEKTPVVIHRVIYGSLERFIGILVEHFAGAFPVWLAPEQVRVIPIGEQQKDYAHKVCQAIQEVVPNARVAVDLSDETLQKKIRNAQLEKIPYMLVVGRKEAERQCVNVRLRSGETLGEMSIENFIIRLRKKIEKKALDL